jgi:hypothetical protein
MFVNFHVASEIRESSSPLNPIDSLIQLLLFVFSTLRVIARVPALQHYDAKIKMCMFCGIVFLQPHR